MLGSISGTIRHKDTNSLVVDVGGVGYKVFVPQDTLFEATVSSPIFLWTHLAVRENALDLFGFPDTEHLDIFHLLITVSGIGPKTALGILNVATPSMLRKAVSGEDTSYLTKVSGIGKKTAEKIVLELRDKLVAKAGEETGDLSSEGDAMEALLSLGYSERDAREALKQVSKDTKSAGDKVKEALKNLSNNA